MNETRILCSEWEQTYQEESDTNNARDRCAEMKPNPANYFVSLRRSVMRVLLMLILGAFLLVSLMAISNYNQESSKKDENHNEFSKKDRTKRQVGGTCHVDVCLTQECVHAASDILQYMDALVDPCEDFFQYTCGSWIKENTHKTGLDDLFYAVNHNIMPEKIDSTLSQLLKTSIPVPEEMMETKPYQNLFTFYDSCLLVPQLENDMSEAMEILKSLKEFQIGRPFERENWDLTKAVLELMRINGAPLLDVIIQADVKRPDKYCINISPPRRYGLIPNLIGPKIQNPFVEEFFRVKGRRRDLFGDLSDDNVMLELLSSLESKSGPVEVKSAIKDFKDSSVIIVSAQRGPSSRRDGEQGSFTGKPFLNILPTDDTLEKTSFMRNNALLTKESLSTTSTPWNTTFSSYTTEAPFTEIARASPSSSTHPRPSTPRSPTTTSSLTTLSPTSVPFSSTEPYREDSASSEIPPTVLGSYTSTTQETLAFSDTSFDEGKAEAKDKEEVDDMDNNEEEGYSENVRKIVSRKEVFKLFKKNLDKKRTEAIGTMVQNTFINISEEILTSVFGNFQPFDVYSAVIDLFVPLLDEIQPTEQEELIAQQHNLLFNHYSMDQLQQLMPVINWQFLLSELFGKNITAEDNIYVFHPAYMTQLNRLITVLDPWVIHYGMAALYAYDVLREAAIAPPGMDREDFCLQASKNVFGDAMSHMYLHHVGNKTIIDIRRHTLSMLEMLKGEVKLSLTRSSWLSTPDRQVAMNKINVLNAEVGAFDRHWDISYINESHEGITINSEETFLTNVMDIYRTFRKELYKIYHEPVDKDMLIWSFTVHPFIVNGFHMQTTNSIVFPEAFFQKPYYSPKAPEYINYGSAGTSIAHEIFHGLDFTGTHFDHLGAMSRPFSNETHYKLREIIECYHKLLTDTFYEEVPVEETLIAMEIDSSATLNENLADIGGIRHAFRAYQRWEALNYREPRLPAINLNAYQLFFVSAVRPYCAVIPNLAKIFLLEMDEHLPNGMRMNAMLMNTPEFAQVFNCPFDSRMVAEQTCPIF